MNNEYKANSLSELDKVASLFYIRKRNLNKLVVAHLNINSLRLKFDSLAQKITGNVDILMISETKLDNSFPEGQFLIEGYSKPYRIDRNCHGGGIMLYVRADIPSKLLSTELLPMEGFYVEINLQKKKWLLCCSYNPNKNAIKSHIEILQKGLALYSSKYENFIVLVDFNVGMDNSDMTVFCDTYDLKRLIKEPTCYKIPGNLFCIDLILTNNPKCFQSSCVVETGLSDFHRMTVTVMKTTFKKFEPKVIHYRDHKNFQNDQYRGELTPKLLNTVFENNNIRLNEF